jgi:iron(III) transport system substrate-binding protein
MPAMTSHYGILINTGLVKPEDEPKSWKDLADPKWKGKILADDPRAAGGGYMSFFVHHDTPGLGLPFLEAYAAQAPVLTRDQGQSQQRVARGEYAMYTPFILSDHDKLKGLPVKYIIPSEGVTYVVFGHALMKNAPRPNAAKLYLDFVLSDEAQLIWARDGHGSVMSEIAAKTPEAVRPIATAKLLGAADPLRQNEVMAIAKRLFK